MVICIFDTEKGTSYIDKDVYEYIVNKYNRTWTLDQGGYLKINYGNKMRKIHRLVFEALGIDIPNNLEVDHIDRNTLNNTQDNLRIVTKSINHFNRGKKSNTTSKYVGVNYKKDRKKFEAQIRINKKKTFLGYYEDEIHAAYAYDIAKKHLIKERNLTYNNVDELIDNKTKDEIELNVMSRIKNAD